MKHAAWPRAFQSLLVFDMDVFRLETFLLSKNFGHLHFDCHTYNIPATKSNPVPTGFMLGTKKMSQNMMGALATHTRTDFKPKRKKRLQINHDLAQNIPLCTLI